MSNNSNAIPGTPALEYRQFPAPHWRVTPASGAGHSEVILVHGLGEHAGRMMPLARKLAELGYRCRLPDLPGHGGDGEEAHRAIVEIYLRQRDAAGILDALHQLPDRLHQQAKAIAADMHRKLLRVSFESIIERIAELASWSAIDGNESAVPHFIWGHSLGGLASFHATDRIQLEAGFSPTGLILGSPAFSPPAAKNPAEAVVVQSALLFSSVTLLRPFAAGLRGIVQVLALDGDGTFANEAVSDLPSERLVHSLDPLQNHRIPLCFAARLLPWMARAKQRASQMRIPVMIYCPASDPIVDTSGSHRIAARLKPPLDPQRSHRFDVHEQMHVHDLARSSCGDAIVRCANHWMRATE